LSTPQTKAIAFRLSPQQEQLLAPAGRPRLTQCAALITGAVTKAELQVDIDRVVARHEILRTTFFRPSGLLVPQQVVHDQLTPAWELDSGGHSLADDSAALQALFEDEARDCRDTAEGPLLRGRLVTLASDRHLLVLTAPAACADAASMVLLLRDLARLHGGDDSRSTLEEPVQYADYAEWRNELLADSDAEADRGRQWWAEMGQIRSEPHRLLFGRPELARGGVPGQVGIDLDAAERRAVMQAAAGARASASLFLEACWHALVGRLSGDTELVIAALESGRGNAELDGAAGAYAQPVPVRTRIAQDTSFAEILDQVRRGRALAARYQDYATAHDLAGVRERLPHAFAYVEIGLDERLGEAAIEIAALTEEPGPSGLALRFSAGRDSLRGQLVYDRGAYTPEDAEEVAARFRVLLASAAADPSCPVRNLALVDLAERDALVAMAPGRRRSSTSAPAPVHHLFEQGVRLTASRPAVCGETGHLSHAELNIEANRLAHHLRALGVGRNVVVGLCMDRTPALITAVLAILKSGGAYLPLNFEHPSARLHHQLEEARAQVLITQESLLGTLPAFDGPIVCVDRDRAAIASRQGEDPERVSEPGDLAYVMYTSGSTGVPKGVAVCHSNLTNYAIDLAERLGADKTDAPDGLQFAVVSAISTDLGNTCVFPPLIAGGCIHLISPAAAMDADAFAAYARRHPLDVLKITPSHLRALLAGGAVDILPRRWLVLGGEPLSWDLVERVNSLGAGCRVLNHYGPTETTVGSCTYEVKAERPPGDPATVPIGLPISNTVAHILDDAIEPVPAGVAGELYIGGAGLARGYIERPEETSERFRPDPSAPGCLYRTGDRARRLRDGNIEFLGRLDGQVKIRGFRVEPGEVEAALVRHPAIVQAAVVPRESGTGDLGLVAYLVAASEPRAEDLQAFLGKSLPDHMVPSLFVTIDRLPFTASGKIDRRALPDPASARQRHDDEYVAPRDELEAEIAGVWAELLGIERVGVVDDFFALGGHSLLATQAIMRVRRAHGEVPLHAMLAAPTVAALAEVVRGAPVAAPADAAQPSADRKAAG
jgi:amino acid adenylation domain-containing protein